VDLAIGGRYAVQVELEGAADGVRSKQQYQFR
jgi:hypothetical protein